MRRRLRQRRPDRPVRHQRRPECCSIAMPAAAGSPKCRTPAAPIRDCGARAARSSTSIATATSISSSPTTSTAAAAENEFCGIAGPPPIRDYCHPLIYPPLHSVLYRNTGRGTFEDISKQSGIGRYRGNGLGVAVDRRRRRWLAGCLRRQRRMPNFLFHNQRDGTFTEIGGLAGVAVASDGKARAGMGTAFADFSGNGRLGLDRDEPRNRDAQPVPEPRTAAVLGRHAPQRRRTRDAPVRRLRRGRSSTTTTTPASTSPSPTATSMANAAQLRAGAQVSRSAICSCATPAGGSRT